MSIFNQPVENNNLVDIYFKHIYFQIFNHIWDDVPSYVKKMQDWKPPIRGICDKESSV
jgi:hypothetical protein